MNGNGTVQSAVQVMKAGAHDFVAKPFGVNELKLLLERVAGPSHAEAGESKAVRRDEIEAWDRSRLSVAEQGFPLGVVQLPAEMVSPVENGRSIMWTRLKDFFSVETPGLYAAPPNRNERRVFPAGEFCGASRSIVAAESQLSLIATA